MMGVRKWRSSGCTLWMADVQLDLRSTRSQVVGEVRI